MKTIFILACVLATTTAFATELKVPKGKGKPAETHAACLTRIAKTCDATYWTIVRKEACYRFRSRACR